MRVNELMIGDWVSWNNTPARVHTVTSAEQIRLSNSNELTELLYSHELDFEPIPLTAEILEKNKLRKNEYSNSETLFYIELCDDILCVRHFCCQEFDIGNSFDEEGELQPFVTIKYVHELQRVLRCCGLWDLANSFKI